jgi:hypothetical protein
MTIAELINNKEFLVAKKKSAIKFCSPVSSVIDENSIFKTLNTSYTDDVTTGKITRKLLANTYNWLDSHGDVHLNGTFTKSIKERKERVWHLHDHEYKVVAKVGEFKDLIEEEIKWRDLGININGKTTALVGESEIIKDYNSKVFNAYLNGKIDQHSVGMIYVKIDLAVNDDSYDVEHKNWLDTIELLGNKEKAYEKGYYWIVKEAKLIEISAVLDGSNELTPTLENIEPTLEDTQKQEQEAAERTLEADRNKNYLSIKSKLLLK